MRLAQSPSAALREEIVPELRIATRKSPLALWQAEFVKRALEDAHDDLFCKLVPMTTSGDRFLNAKLTEDGELNITFHSSETGIGRLLERVREAGISVGDLSTEQPNLEDVFVAMTTEPA